MSLSHPFQWTLPSRLRDMCYLVRPLPESTTRIIIMCGGWDRPLSYRCLCVWMRVCLLECCPFDFDTWTMLIRIALLIHLKKLYIVKRNRVDCMGHSYPTSSLSSRLLQPPSQHTNLPFTNDHRTHWTTLHSHHFIHARAHTHTHTHTHTQISLFLLSCIEKCKNIMKV